MDPKSLPPQARRHPERRRRRLQPPHAGRRGGHRQRPSNPTSRYSPISSSSTAAGWWTRPGDNLLAEFASVVDAVQCAVAVQKELQARNAELPENRRMLFRIGVNLGDVIEEE